MSDPHPSMKVLDRVRDKLTEHFGHGGVLQTDRPDHHGKLPGSFQNPWPSADDHTHPVDFPFSREKEVHHGMKGAPFYFAERSSG